jgi:hypothetical protein
MNREKSREDGQREEEQRRGEEEGGGDTLYVSMHG